ncbi:cytochrome P450 [Echria macrotheca]|uniref:Cytochrome P450 n=1 Tax=Echria macrotheca TaxID=438768 RepID=A0AAJ0FAQ1_9PEZI|nr:cytochrome P450 [Echria macrotheca]
MSRDLGTDRNFLPRLHKAVHGALAAGPELNVMSAHTVGLLERTLSDLAGRGTTPVKLYDWMRRNVMVATTNTIFGPMDPFQHPANIDAWIEFETNGISALGMGLPKWMVREAVKARETLFVAFDEYFRRGGLAQASTFFQRRIEFYRAEQIPQGDINRLAVADNIAFSTNLLPTAFWLIYHIYSDPECLRLCRTELESGVTRDGESSQVISYGYIKESCPTLQAVLRESFRFHGFGFAPRVALEDHMLDGRFLIKKGGYVFTPYIVQHRDPQNWGADVDEFRFQRFLPGEDGKRLKHHPAALRGFGYGAHLCPGRHFATAELLLLCALMTLRFDLKPAGGSEWPQLSVHKSLQVAALEQPDQDVEVVFHPREGVNQNGWSVRMA